ncbi:MAG: FtsX-like permease family protein [Paramuribaculum sp.]|nr:FtsX-like permease family protein [Paramuribaculum sp.]
MKNNIFRQTAFEMRQQPLITSVSLIGTAFAIFLMMVVMMIQSVRTVPMAPESNRTLMMYGMWFDATINENSDGSSGLSPQMAKRIYDGLDGVEYVTFMTGTVESIDVDAPGHSPVNLYMRETDASFWKVFDHPFVAGSPYGQANVDAPTENRVAVLSEDAVRQVLGCSPEEAVGRTINISQRPTTVIGVVRDSSPLAPFGFGQIFRPLIPGNHNWGNEYWGDVMAAMVIKPGTTREYLQQQVKARYAEIDAELKPDGGKTRYHEQPFDHELAISPMGSNTTPDNSKEKRERAILLLILLLVPAINMSSLTQSRLKRRYAEVGVKRAYGAPRNRILAEILTENFIITLVGGAIGLILSILAALLLTDTVFAGLAGNDSNWTSISVSASIPFTAVFNWAMFGFALACCFLLNLLSAGIPAWRASRVSPVEALHS